MKTITSETIAWITDVSHMGPDDLRDPKNISALAFSSMESMAKHGWTRVGKATISVEIPDEKALINNKVEALRNELAAVRAKAEKDAVRIQGRINDLLAITYDSSE